MSAARFCEQPLLTLQVLRVTGVRDVRAVDSGTVCRHSLHQETLQPEFSGDGGQIEATVPLGKWDFPMLILHVSRDFEV